MIISFPSGLYKADKQMRQAVSLGYYNNYRRTYINDRK